MKILNGLELADFIKFRQLQQVGACRQAKILPRLAIIRTSDDPVIDTYLRLKENYGQDIGVEVDIYKLKDSELQAKIKQLNDDESVHGIIIQLPLQDESQTESAVNLVSPGKDVDGLAKTSNFTPATALAIDWLLGGYNIDLRDKKIAIVGKGRLVGAPLAKLWQQSGYDITICDRQTKDLEKVLNQADIIVSATGSAGLITSPMVKSGAVVVDAGTASEHGKIVGDVADEVRQRADITITPIKGGVGPLTVTVLFENLIRAIKQSN